MTGLLGHRGLLLQAGDIFVPSWNPDAGDIGTDWTLSNSDRRAQRTASAQAIGVIGFRNAGKVYWEVEQDNPGNGGTLYYSATGLAAGAAVSGYSSNAGFQVAYTGSFSGRTASTGLPDTGNLSIGSPWGHVVMFAIDYAAGKVWFGKDGTWYGGGDPAAGTSPSLTYTTPSNLNGTPGRPVASYSGTFGGGTDLTINLAAAHMQHSIPSGFMPWAGQ